MKTLLAIAVIITTGFLFLSFDEEEITCGSIGIYSTEQHQYSGIPPAAKTGAPGEGFCVDCHSLGILNGTLGSISIDFNGGVNFYKPDSTYLIKIKVKELGNTVFGFETTLLDSNTIKVGSYNITDSNTTAYQALIGREYISHKDVITNLSMDSLEWEYEWVAPSANVGIVTLYSVGVTNLNFISIPAGNVYNDSLKIYPDPSIVGIDEGLNSLIQTAIYPNPSNGFFYIQGQKVDNKQVIIYNLKGQIVKKFSPQTNFSNRFDIQGIKTGVYLVKYFTDGGFITKKIIAQ